MLVTILIPARNESGSIAQVIERVRAALEDLERQGKQGELVLIDDGSTDGTGDIAAIAGARYPWLHVIRHRRNQGLTAALRSGFAAAQGDVIIFLPADLESDPAEDVPRLLTRMEEGFDVVCGWRLGRHEGKVAASRIYNWVSGWLFGLALHDMNWIKAFRREVVESLPPLRSDWHRFLVMLAAAQGFRVGEVQTNYHPRRSGRSKFGFKRIPVSLLDVLVVKFLLTFSRAPMRFFGGLGLAALIAGAFTFLYLAVLYLTQQTQQRPIFILAGSLALAGLILILVGFVAELIVNQAEEITLMRGEIAELRRQLSPPAATAANLHLEPAGSVQREDSGLNS